MTINLNAPQMTELKPRIVVIGVGGAGGNAVNNMISSGLEGVEFIVANTDSQALTQSTADRRIQLGAAITQGLGCGARPDVGRAAAEEAIDQILDHMAGTHMAFITAGMGGGTGTGAAPVIAEALRAQGILTVGVVTKPFQFEGSQRLLSAERGIEELQTFVDTLIVIPNQNLFRIANEKTTFADAFSMADDVLHSGVRGITDLMINPGLINLDFADVKTVMAEMGKAMMGTGEAEGEKRAVEAAEAAISNPLLDDVSMQGARGVLINITGGMDLTLYELDEAANRVRQEVDPNANIIVGSAIEDSLNGRMRVSVVATGIEIGENAQRPVITPRLAAVSGQPVSAPAEAAPAQPAAMQPEPAQPVTVEPAADSAIDNVPEIAGATTAMEVAMEARVQAEEPPALPFTFGERVPAPKPPQAEPESMAPTALGNQRKADVSMAEGPFRAPPASRPEKDRSPLLQPDPLAEAEALNPTDQPAKRKSRGFSLFRRKQAPKASETATPAPQQPRPEQLSPRRMRQAIAADLPADIPAGAPVDVIEETAPPASAVMPEYVEPAHAAVSEPAAPERSLPPETAQPLAPPQTEEDLLEIPSFLRRQAN
ncbi:MAG: cell division protein FtsZ [Alphaproteobacteria bacterium]|jgi:cell division protein FtsZ|nr:cell division protein FtsZ [Rhodospirillaceae bacterium]MDP6020100.1 cell division protein FtsZ [Alphaproteobacteria bacterium]MDP6255790.1 cell division protein FtsZ [Alphaproteobacteria bacterium]MDP7054101.1 cell division protein FtsZ [Alphaproteobacteria bacterium]MDP7227412.1 cell division protein FtsZ [Alphaproteobacteria bacterium]|tara:strand:+ start:6606 stop:8405 length:1800 start_codon:yes stop_codon:yes gene_type:complete